ncbi:related to SAC1-Phosphatidylinositol phosphate phosphatase [Sporisorium reilianum f. sp. reilianum]|uniref:Related to SAC1-Phosphatidylinositol phosphate phosphatase n=1 Tax=Sporisorium reilianum f. sp. reilianum TaxID=72559 RepID=A0A2N8UBF6_9BASI|nr:related to SAC1-Phosphatidylinositol phosphate phosphatase [Sporisorium reilianum f. sp. reilianum]
MFKAIFSSSSSSKQPGPKSNTNDASSSPSASKSRTNSPNSSPAMSSVPLPPSRGSSSVMASWTVPPFPHPLPERRIGIMATEQGLLVYPRSSSYLQQHRQHASHAPHHAKASTTSAPTTAALRPFGSGEGFKVATIGTSNAASRSASTATPTATSVLSPLTSLDVGFLINWGKDAKITPLQPSAWKSILDVATPEQPSLECFGIVGLSRFWSSSYLFVITSFKLIGHYFHNTRPIFCCTGVLAIPLLHQEASQALRSQIAKQGGAPAASAPDAGPADSSIDESTSAESDSDSESDSSESDYDDVETPAAIPKEPFFSNISNSQRADTLCMPKSRPWLTRAARAVSDGRIQTISEDSATQSQLADAAQEQPDVVEVPHQDILPQSPDGVEASTLAAAEEPVTPSATPHQQWNAAKQAELEDKAVRETAKYWARGEFWFSYDFDLTTTLQKKRLALESNAKQDSAASAKTTSHPARVANVSAADDADAPAFPLLAEPYPNLPLWRRADRRFWHNEHMSKDLIHAGLHAYILPIMQGYLQTVALPIQSAAQDQPEQTTDAVLRCQVMVISRRSKERAGLRYQRRGINESGQVANFVETEQILYVLRRSANDMIGDVLSFVQIRGSIPLYWSQSPFSLKPPPVLERTDAENTAACRNHFAAQVERYGSITCINLAEQGGKEGHISKAYRTAVESLRSEAFSKYTQGGKEWDRQKLHYVDFDFHKECAGMKFENVAKLVHQMHDTLAEMQYYHHRTTGADAQVLSTQTGVFRVSCLDCLDRTNVVQSAFARHVLKGQLAKLAISVGAPPTAAAASA